MFNMYNENALKHMKNKGKEQINGGYLNDSPTDIKKCKATFSHIFAFPYVTGNWKL